MFKLLLVAGIVTVSSGLWANSQVNSIGGGSLANQSAESQTAGSPISSGRYCIIGGLNGDTSLIPDAEGKVEYRNLQITPANAWELRHVSDETYTLQFGGKFLGSGYVTGPSRSQFRGKTNGGTVTRAVGRMRDTRHTVVIRKDDKIYTISADGITWYAHFVKMP